MKSDDERCVSRKECLAEQEGETRNVSKRREDTLGK